MAKHAVLEAMRDRVHRDTDQLFGTLAIVQWMAVAALALAVAPAYFVPTLFGGAIVCATSGGLIRLRAGWWVTRHANAIVQLSWSALLIAITSDHLDAELHVVASLALLALYRDWRVIATGTAVALGYAVARDALALAGPDTLGYLAGLAGIAGVAAYMCIRGARELAYAATREVRLERSVAVVDRKVADRVLELQDSLDRYRALVENIDAVQFEVDVVSGELHYIAPQAVRLLDCTPEDLARGHVLGTYLHPDDRPALLAALAACASGERPSNEPVDYRIVTRLGRTVHARTFMRREGTRRVRGITLDVTRDRQLAVERQQLQKLESVGRLAGGVAHEINTPIQYIGDSIEFARGAIAEIAGVFDRQRDAIKSILDGAPEAAELARGADAAFRHSDLPYVFEELPQALDRATGGVDRVAAIVKSMKAVAHPDKREMADVDLNQAIESTLIVATNSYRYVADLHTDFGTLPAMRCHAGEITQVVLNLVLNAAHAIGKVVGKSGARGRIDVRTRAHGDHVTIAITDTGCGIPDAIADRVFEPFFTTKDVGQGTGQGLAVARSVIVGRYRGTLTFDSSPAGTTFTVRLPVARDAGAAAA